MSKSFDYGRLARRYRVTRGAGFRLERFDPGDTADFGKNEREQAEQALGASVGALAEMQETLWAQDRWALLLIFQAMDAAGKDGAIKHVMSGVNPQGVQVHSFKAPSEEELEHDFLWRAMRRLPERGGIGIFNRSYYEETLVVRVHPELLERQRLPDRPGARIWDERFEDIRNVERYLQRNGVAVRKFFLHVSREEQKKRFLARLDDPRKHWKFNAADVREREHWDDYRSAYEKMIRHTATPWAPWHVIPADRKWFTRLAVAATIVDTLATLDLEHPRSTRARRKELAAARRLLERERRGRA